jgi:YVTN family beta-propeller protein
VEVQVLGPLRVIQDGREVLLGGAKQRALLALLLLRHDHFVLTDTLIEDLWAGEPPSTANKIVQVYVSQLRKALGDGVIETGAGGYRFRLDPADLDAARFEQLLDRARELLAAGGARAARDVFREALALWRGSPLSDVRYESFARDEIGRLEELRLVALEGMLEADLAIGRNGEAVAELEPLVREHPLRESLLRLYMLALYRAGRQADALAAYQGYRTTTSDEHGLDPSRELEGLQTAILNRDPDLGAPRRTSIDLGGRRRSRRGLLAFAAAVALAGLATVVVLHHDGGGAPPLANTDGVALIDADTGRIQYAVAVNGTPAAVAADATGVWVANLTAGTVAHVDPRGRAVVQTIPVGTSPGSIAVGGGGVWVVNHDDDTVSWINPESDTVVRTISVGAGPLAVAYGAGSVWVTNGEDRTLSRIDPQTGTVTARIRTNAVGRGLVVAAGAVWVSDEASRSIVAIDPRTGEVRSTVPVGAGPASVAYGAGSIWVANTLDDTVSRINPKTFAVRAAIPVPDGPTSVTFARGAAWASVEFGSRVVRIDPVRDTVTAATRIGGQPQGINADEDGIWVAVQASGTGHRGGRLVVAGDDVGTLDPGVAPTSRAVTHPLYDALTSLRHVGAGAGAELVPDLAAALPTPTEHETRYTFQLRRDIRYSDGTVLRAVDFRRALERDLWLGQTPALGLDSLPGASACAAHRQCDLSHSVVVAGPRTISFRLSAPDPRFLLTLSDVVPVPAATPLRHQVSTPPVPGTGPYAVETYVPGKVITLVRNPYFRTWSAAARPDGYADEIVYRIVDDQDAAVRLVADGSADLVSVLHESPPVTRFVRRHPLQVHRDPQQATVFVFLNVDRSPFNDARVRRAINFAVDRDKVVALHGAQYSSPTCQLVPPTTTGHRGYCPYTLPGGRPGEWVAPDLPRARALVTASKTLGSRIVVWSFPDFGDEARYFVRLLDRLGYRARLHLVPTVAGYFSGLDRHPEVKAGFFGWFGTSLAVDVLETVGCHYAVNPAHFCDPRIDTQVDRLRVREPVDPAGAADLAATIDRRVTNAAPWVPLFTPDTVDLTSARVGNYQLREDEPALDQLWVR